MSGEIVLVLDPPQPGGRTPAPGRLATVQAFMNTHFDLAGERGGELLVDAAALQSWLAARGLLAESAGATEQDRQRALAVREGLRALAFANNGRPADPAKLAAMAEASRGTSVEVQIEPGGPRFAAASQAGVAGALGVVLAIVAQAMLQGDWPRLKACPGRHCGWVFFDHSRNQSARWCAMKVCGDREKARTYYERHRDRRP
jgi:predicted RNA-binding Zn ribbon-like protein